VTVNIDSNNNGTNYFKIGRHTTGDANNLLTLDESGNLTIAGELQANKVCRWGDNIKSIDGTYGDTDRCPSGYCAISMVSTGNTTYFPEGGSGARGSFPQHSGDAKLLCCRCQM